MARKSQQSDLQNLPACASEFITQVIKKMRYRRKVRHDVQAELSAHFEDELADCKTAEEKEQRAERLIADFGDAKLLAVLLRRAKKRCRPLWRTVIARTFQIVGVLCICFVFYTVWFLSGKPRITTNYVAELNRIVRPTADDSLNAVPLYNQAAELLEKAKNKTTNLLLVKKYDDANNTDKQFIQKWLNDNKQILDLVKACAQKPYYWHKYKGREMLSVVLPDNLSDFRTFTYCLLKWRALLSAENGQYENAFEDIKTAYRLGQHLKGSKLLVEQLISIAIEALSAHTLRDILSKYEVSSESLASWQKDFEKLIENEDFIVNFKTERLYMYDELQRCFTDDRIGGGHIYTPRYFVDIMNYRTKITDTDRFRSFCVDLFCPTYFLFKGHTKEQTQKSSDRLYDFYEQLSSKTPATINKEYPDLEKQTQTMLGGNIFMEVLAPDFKKIIQLNFRSSVEVHASLVILAILRYKQDKGQCPQNLDEMKEAGYIKEIPMDPFSDKPLIYRKTDNDFVLYSVGLNFVDDGGQPGKDKKGNNILWADNGDAVFWPVSKSL